MAEVTYRPLDDLEADPRNPKGHDTPTIVQSLRRFGMADPVVVDQRTGLIVAGHGRAEALRHLRHAGETPPQGITDQWEVPVYEGWASRDDDEAAAALVALNRTTETGGWDDRSLVDLLGRLAQLDGGLEGVGYGTDEIEELRRRLDRMNPWKDRSFVGTADPGEVQLGQLWRVGDQLVACADARQHEVWDALLEGSEPGMVFTDPPYGIDYTGGAGAERESLAADLPDDAPLLLDQVLDAVLPRCATGAATYICLPPGNVLPDFAAALHARGLWRWGICWAKDHHTFGRADYHQQWELIVYGWSGVPRLHPVEGRKDSTLWTIPRPHDSDDHPTMKPVELPARAIRNSTDEGWLVVDPFLGAGSTLVAAAQEGRTGAGIEIEPGYVRRALERIAEASGHEPELVRDDLAAQPA